MAGVVPRGALVQVDARVGAVQRVVVARQPALQTSFRDGKIFKQQKIENHDRDLNDKTKPHTRRLIWSSLIAGVVFKENQKMHEN